MGNRAVITLSPYNENNIGIYLHWNGGRASIEGFLKAADKLEIRLDDDYFFARFTQMIGNFFGGCNSVGVGIVKELDQDNFDNGVYVIDIGNLSIVDRKFNTEDVIDLKKTNDIAESIINDQKHIFIK